MKNRTKNFIKNDKKEKKGITLIALIVTITILLILVSIGTYSGVSVIKSSQFTKFQTELKIMQTKINELYGNSEENVYGLEINGNIKTQAEKVFTESESGITDYTGYRYFDQNTIKNSLKVEGVESEFFINMEKRSIVSYNGFTYEGKTYYTLEQIPNSLYNIEYENKNTAKPTFEVNTEFKNGKHKVTIPSESIQYDGYIKKWDVQYKKIEEENWNTVSDLSFNIEEDGKYYFRLANNSANIISDQKQVTLVNSNEEILYEAETLTFDGTNYINTGIKLFNEENYDKDFEIEFTINYIGTNIEKQGTLLNCKYENSSEYYPGFVMRKLDTSNTEMQITGRAGLSNDVAGSQPFTNESLINKKIVISRSKGIIYYSIGDSEKVALYTQNKKFDTPLSFGASLQGDGITPQRFFKGTVTNITIKLINNKQEEEEPDTGTEVYSAYNLTFTGENYINTGVKLFSEENYGKKFEISFVITNIGSNMVNQATLLNSKYENQSEGYPGFVLRKNSDTATHIKGDGAKNGNISFSNSNLINKKFTISREGNIIYYSVEGVNNGEKQELFTQNKKFDTPVTFGASLLSDNETPQRYYKGSITDLSIKFLD